MDSQLPLYNKKVLILGNRSYKNLWDELILLWTIRLLQSQGNQIVVSAYDPKWLEKFFAQFKDLNPIEYLHEFPKGIRSFFSYFFSSRRKELKSYRAVDAVIIGGGEILTEESPSAYWYWNFWLLPFIRTFQPKEKGFSSKISLYLMGGIQIPQKKINRWLFDRLLRHTDAIFARDEESVQKLQAYGYSPAKLFMDTSFFAYPRADFRSSKKEKIALINLNHNGSDFFEQLVQDCRDLLQQGFELYYVPVSKGQQTAYNDHHYQSLLEKSLGISLKILDRETDFSAFVKQLSSAEQVITARLHLYLIASFVGTTVKVYPYQKKIFKMQAEIEKLVDSL